MKFVVTALMTVTVVACSAPPSPRSPIAPDPTANSIPTAFTPGVAKVNIWAMAIEASGSGICLAGATLEIVRGQAVGQSFTQEPCNVWAYDGGFFLKDLTADVELTLRFSAPGYASKEVTVVPTPSGWLTAMVIGLSKIQ